jgi:uncharacterized protein YkwD
VSRATALLAAAAAILTVGLGAAASAGGATGTRASAVPSGCSNASAAAARVPAPAVGSAVRCLVNVQRGRHGLPPLQVSARLRAAAAAHSADMVARAFFDHVSPGGGTLSDRARHAGYPGRMLGEDIGWGTYDLGTPAAIVAAWMHSPPHRAIILNGRFREIGVGVAIGTPAGPSENGAVYTLDVGRR